MRKSIRKIEELRNQISKLLDTLTIEEFSNEPLDDSRIWYMSNDSDTT